MRIEEPPESTQRTPSLVAESDCADTNPRGLALTALDSGRVIDLTAQPGTTAPATVPLAVPARITAFDPFPGAPQTRFESLPAQPHAQSGPSTATPAPVLPAERAGARSEPAATLAPGPPLEWAAAQPATPSTAASAASAATAASAAGAPAALVDEPPAPAQTLARGWLLPGLTGEIAVLTSGIPLLGRRRPQQNRDPEAADGVLPAPPDDQEKFGYATRYVWILTCCSLVSFSCISLSQFRLARSTPWLWAYLPLLGFSVLYYLISLRVNAFTRDFDLREHRRLVSSWRPVEYPDVDVFLPICGEPLDVLHNTWLHVQKMVRKYPGTAVPLVLDDRNDPRCAELALAMGFRYGSRPDRGWYKKAGNLRFGFENSNGRYILILDADFAPRPDMLTELVPYLEADPQLAIIQSPQFFRVLDRQNWIERGAGAVQELFYRSVQVSRQGRDGAICVGSCALYRREALAQNGGTTLIEHSEDVHTGFDLRRLGWNLRYIPVALSTGLCPDTARAFQNQQYRWCSGSMSLMLSRKFWQTKLPAVTRMCYLSGFFYYLHTALFTFVGPSVPIVLLLLLPDRITLTNTGLVLPSLIYATVIFPAWHRSSYRLEAWAVRMMYGWAHVFAISDLIRRRQQGWQPTGATQSGRQRPNRLTVGVALWGGGTAAVWVGAALARMLTRVPADYGLILAGGLFYALTVGRVLLLPKPRSDR